ncbi:HCL292Cp [Eremothecium sinecaudum]|uniref:HCL292Cp n=1 Tax=Eremothecium sinecaudum TaxID=45286 RepID=A0A120K1X8_9SACH|nr:HCL292Cp [Eremothecium sinecaudum]AMD19859.1 HCL292Cp [Eremothecium sinecaudum]
MGVQSLWEILGPTARPVRLESLSNMKMAVDASIWIYQFLKAARDKDGNRLLHAHVVGFFRRICKLLYFGIRPVFVFDGGAPLLKRETIRLRKERRQGKRESANVRAKKLLAMQIHRESSGHEQSPKKESSTKSVVFRPSDEYELPQIPGFAYDESDTRISPADEYKAIMQSLDDLEGIDIESINPASREFDELPKSTQYMILSASRLRSRLRMGYSKEQLEHLFPDSMEFSKFQIDRVKRRNFFTQKLMDITGMHDGGAKKGDYTNRIAGQKGREYKLTKTDTGWALSLGEQDGSEASRAIVVHDPLSSTHTGSRKQPKNDSDKGSDDEEEDIEWEDIDVDPNSQEKEVDYSLRAAYLPNAKTIDGAAGSQSFLDTRAGDTSTKSTTLATQKLPRHVEVVDEESDEDEYLDHLQEIQMMEEIQKSRNVEKARAKAPEDIAVRQPAVVESKKAAPAQNTDEVDRRRETDAQRQAEIDERFKMLPLTNADGDLIEPPNFTLEKESFLFESKPKEQPKESSEEKKVIPEVPLWFQSSSVENAHKAPLTSQVESPDVRSDFGIHPARSSSDLEVNSDDDSVIEVIEDNAVTAENTPIPETIPASETEPATRDSVEHGATDAESILDYYISENEEEELVEQLGKEQEDYNFFRKTLNPNLASTAFIEDEIYEKAVKDKRDADEVTPDMVRDIQELLSRFGIPFITAPMEAEAQCAELLSQKLVDAIITDDSDIFLFGGSKVYKNMFHEKNYVEYYNANAISAELGLDRDKFIAIAQLLGSDYTTGVKGVGKVAAMEILAEYGDLESFRNWYNENQFDKVKLQQESSFQKSLRKKLVKNEVVLDESFPSIAVREAYLNPVVDHDPTKFVWGMPNLDRLRSYMHEHVNWSIEKSDEILIPLIKDLNDKKKTGTQTTLVEFFPTRLLETEKKLKLGKRFQEATGRLKKRRTK